MGQTMYETGEKQRETRGGKREDSSEKTTVHCTRIYGHKKIKAAGSVRIHPFVYLHEIPEANEVRLILTSGGEAGFCIVYVQQYHQQACGT